jgi:phosphatidate phosphatase LPIN
MTPPAVWCERLNIEANSKFTFMFENEIVHCAIFVWNHDDKIVISDIDGTITQSDVPGMLSSFLGLDYSHKGVASLYNRLHSRNLKVVYMTARSITMIELTRGYLRKVAQKTGDETHILPHGPVITTPNTMLNALYREVVVRRPETFKITILKCIQSLFPEKDPFIYGFGNRPTDDISYQAVGIRPSRIFRIDSSSRVLIPSLNRYFEGYSEVEKHIHDL